MLSNKEIVCPNNLLNVAQKKKGVKAGIVNAGKPKEMAEKISKGKISKFINDNTLLNQIWIMDPKKKVSDILKENKIDKEVKILDFVRYKVGEGV